MIIIWSNVFCKQGGNKGMGENINDRSLGSISWYVIWRNETKYLSWIYKILQQNIDTWMASTKVTLDVLHLDARVSDS